MRLIGWGSGSDHLRRAQAHSHLAMSHMTPFSLIDLAVRDEINDRID